MADEPLLDSKSVDNPNVRRAFKFLTHPRVANASLEKRVAFLRSKGCSDEEITEARTLMPADESGAESGGSYGALPPLQEAPPNKRKARYKKKPRSLLVGESNPKQGATPMRRRLVVGPGVIPGVLCCLILAAIIFVVIWFDVIARLVRILRTSSSSSQGEETPFYMGSYSYSYAIELEMFIVEAYSYSYLGDK